MSHVPAFLNENRIPAGTFEDRDIAKELNETIEKQLGIKKAIKTVMNYQVYLNDDSIAVDDYNAVKKLVIKGLEKKQYIISAFDLKNLSATTLPSPQKERITNGYNPKRSGDIQFTFKPGYFDGGKRGTTHGAWNPYDAHIPLLWFGWKVKPGKSNREVYMTDISATIAAMLQIQMPSGSVGKAITELIK